MAALLPAGLRSRPLFGQAAVLRALADLAESPGAVLLTGPAGVGKSRVAAELAHQQATKRPVYWVSLYDVPPSAWRRTLIQTVCSDLDVAAPEEGRLQTFLYRLRQETAPLVVLDNFEHLWTELAELGKLADRLPNVTWLLTSRLADSVGGASLGLETKTIRLEPLDARAASEYFCLGLSEPPVHPTLQEITQLTEGLPLLLDIARGAMNRLGPEAGIRWLRAAPSNSELSRVVERSIAMLNSDARSTLLDAVALGGRFSEEDLRRVSRLSEGATLQSLLELAEASLLRRLGDGFSLYPLIAQTVESMFSAEVMSRRNEVIRWLALLYEPIEGENLGHQFERWRTHEDLLERVAAQLVRRGVLDESLTPEIERCVLVLFDLWIVYGVDLPLATELANLLGSNDRIQAASLWFDICVGKGGGIEARINHLLSRVEWQDPSAILLRDMARAFGQGRSNIESLERLLSATSTDLPSGRGFFSPVRMRLRLDELTATYHDIAAPDPSGAHLTAALARAKEAGADVEVARLAGFLAANRVAAGDYAEAAQICRHQLSCTVPPNFSLISTAVYAYGFLRSFHDVEAWAARGMTLSHLHSVFVEIGVLVAAIYNRRTDWVRAIVAKGPRYPTDHAVRSYEEAVFCMASLYLNDGGEATAHLDNLQKFAKKGRVAERLTHALLLLGRAVEKNERGLLDEARVLIGTPILGTHALLRLTEYLLELRRVTVEDSERLLKVNQVSIDFKQKRVLWSVVTALSMLPVRSEVLFKSAWPETKISTRSADERVRAAIHNLRAMGLQDLIHSDADGYRWADNVVLLTQQT